MRFTSGPRLILIGGSNLSFGVDSRILKDALKINPVNLGIQGSIGLSYLMRSALSSVQKGDVVLVVPEYNNFYGEFAYGAEPLLRLVMDVNRQDLKYLGFRHALCIAPFLPKYLVSKFNPSEYDDKISTSEKIYARDAFNEYGDATAHWRLQPVPFAPEPVLNENFNEALISEMAEFNSALNARGARMFVSFPPFEEESYHHNEKQIMEVEEVLRKNFRVIGCPSRYMFRRNQMFNTPYHLNGEAVKERSRMLAADIKEVLPVYVVR